MTSDACLFATRMTLKFLAGKPSPQSDATTCQQPHNGVPDHVDSTPSQRSPCLNRCTILAEATTCATIDALEVECVEPQEHHSCAHIWFILLNVDAKDFLSFFVVELVSQRCRGNLSIKLNEQAHKFKKRQQKQNHLMFSRESVCTRDNALSATKILDGTQQLGEMLKMVSHRIQ